MNDENGLAGVELCIDDDKKALTAAEALDKALACAAGKPLFTLAYTPTFCGFLKSNRLNADGKLDTLKKGSIIPADIFELRCFCESFELRWVREGETGRAVTLREEETDGQSEPKFFKRSGQYILWGKGDEQGRLFEHRVGELPVPPDVSISEGKRACLTFVEYFREDKYGNMAWHSERLTGITPFAGAAAPQNNPPGG